MSLCNWVGFNNKTKETTTPIVDFLVLIFNLGVCSRLYFFQYEVCIYKKSMILIEKYILHTVNSYHILSQAFEISTLESSANIM